MRYDKAKEGDWIQPIKKGYKMRCCDCGSVHTLNFRITYYSPTNPRVQFQAFRDNRATGQVRRHIKKKR